MSIEKITDAVINRRATATPKLCLCFRTPKAECSLCADLCPVGAVTVSGREPEIGLECIDCGVCYAVCPSCALAARNDEDEDIIAQMKPLTGKDVWRISCRRGDNEADLVLTCLGRLTEALLLHPLRAAGMTGVEIVRPDCDECSMTRSMAGFDKLLTRVAPLAAMAGRTRDSITVRKIQKNAATSATNTEKQLSRRAFLDAIRTRTAAVAASTLPAVTEAVKSCDSFHEKPGNRKRETLIRVLREVAQPGRDMVRITVAAAEAITAAPAVNCRRCTGCGACAAVCPTDALLEERSEESFALLFRADLCINCGICAKICMTKAISLHETVELNTVLDPTPVALFAATMKKCRVCHYSFIGMDTDGICPLCVEIHSKQQNAIKMLFAKQEL